MKKGNMEPAGMLKITSASVSTRPIRAMAPTLLGAGTSQINGHVQVQLSAHKIDQGGEGVAILAYHNDKAIQGQQIEPRDMQDVVQKICLKQRLKREILCCLS